MLYSDDFIFLHLQKTGGNHVAKLLGRTYALTKRGKHNGIAGHIRRPYVLLGIRNPWDWYVSLWAYGCQKEGTLWSYLTSSRQNCLRKLVGLHLTKPASWNLAARHAAALPGKRAAHWRDLYRDPEDAGAFRRWLKSLHDAPTSRQTGEDFSALPLAAECGLMTARYLATASRMPDWHSHRESIRSVDDAVGYDAYFGAATHYIRTESLEEDLAAVLKAMGRPIGADALRAEKTNSSKHRPASYYYDDETAGLIASRDRLIVEKHGYTLS